MRARGRQRLLLANHRVAQPSPRILHPTARHGFGTKRIAGCVAPIRPARHAHRLPDYVLGAWAYMPIQDSRTEYLQWRGRPSGNHQCSETLRCRIEPYVVRICSDAESRVCTVADQPADETSAAKCLPREPSVVRCCVELNAGTWHRLPPVRVRPASVWPGGVGQRLRPRDHAGVRSGRHLRRRIAGG